MFALKYAIEILLLRNARFCVFLIFIFVNFTADFIVYNNFSNHNKYKYLRDFIICVNSNFIILGNYKMMQKFCTALLLLVFTLYILRK